MCSHETHATHLGVAPTTFTYLSNTSLIFICLVHGWPANKSQALAHCEQPISKATTFLELLGFLLTLTEFVQVLHGMRGYIIIACDNETAVRGLVCCISGKPQYMSIIAETHNVCAASFIIPRFD